MLHGQLLQLLHGPLLLCLLLLCLLLLYMPGSRWHIGTWEAPALLSLGGIG